METYGIEKLGIVNPKAVNRGSFKERRGQAF